MYEPFLTWLYKQPDPFTIPAHVDLPDAEFAMAGYRRPGPAEAKAAVGDDAVRRLLKAVRLTEKQRQCLEYVAQGERPPFKRTTVESLARHGLVELIGGVGWRATQIGVDWLAAYEITQGGAQ